MSSVAGKTVIITGSSRGVGADTAKILASQGANVVINYRQKAPRATKVVKEITEAGGRAIAVQADITDPESRGGLFRAAQDEFGGVDVLILNASGGMETELGEGYALKLNRDAQNDTLTEALELLPRGGRVVFVTSHQAHFINEVETMPEYEAVAKSKRAGEDTRSARVPEMAEKGVSVGVVPADMIEGTGTATLVPWTSVERLRASSTPSTSSRRRSPPWSPRTSSPGTWSSWAGPRTSWPRLASDRHRHSRWLSPADHDAARAPRVRRRPVSGRARFERPRELW